MGVTTYLELAKSMSADPGDESLVLFGFKAALPVAWFVFFEPEDFAAVVSEIDGSEYTMLRREKTSAIEVARRRLAALAPHSTPALTERLRRFVDSVEASGGAGVLVLNSHRYDASREELVEAVEWLAAVSLSRLSSEQLEVGASIFDEGLEWASPGDDEEVEEAAAVNDDAEVLDPPLGIGDEAFLTGWPVEAANVEWYEREVD